VFAYVFWHQRDDAYSAQLYEEGLASFHTRLSALGVKGFLGSFTFKVSGVPWITGEGYEDWYLVAGLGVLEEINALIGDPIMRGVHDSVARMSVNGKGTILAHVNYPALTDGASCLIATPCLLFFNPKEGRGGIGRSSTAGTPGGTHPALFRRTREVSGHGQ